VLALVQHFLVPACMLRSLHSFKSWHRRLQPKIIISLPLSLPDMDSDYQGFWQDCEIRFDVSSKYLAPCPGEFEIETLDGIEDS
jgi:hypothetical protein